MRAALIRADRRSYSGRTDVIKLIGAFHEHANASKKQLERVRVMIGRQECQENKRRVDGPIGEHGVRSAGRKNSRPWKSKGEM